LAWRRKELGLDFAISIDGGVELHNAADIVRAGCDWWLQGRRFFTTPGPAEAFVGMQRAAREATLAEYELSL